MLDSNVSLLSVRDILLEDLPACTAKPHIRLRRIGRQLVLAGELPNVAIKRRVLDRAVSLAGTRGIVDRLRVEPRRRMADAELRDELLRALIDEPAFSILAIQEKSGGRTALVRNPCKRAGFIEYEAQDGVAILKGAVPGLGHKRLAGVLAWWVPGTRDVVNSLAVTPIEEDSDEDILDAVRLAIEKDNGIESWQVRATVSDRVVTLCGHVSDPETRDRVERDAWYVFGVEAVINRLSVRS